MALHQTSQDHMELKQMQVHQPYTEVLHYTGMAQKLQVRIMFM